MGVVGDVVGLGGWDKIERLGPIEMGMPLRERRRLVVIWIGLIDRDYLGGDEWWSWDSTLLWSRRISGDIQ